jgi:Ca2+-transporting ATPase
LTLLNSSLGGLDGETAKERLQEFGPNELVEKKKTAAWVIFLSQFKNFLVIILIVAAILSVFLGEIADAIVILVIVIFASLLGFIQEYRAERAMEALKRMTAPSSSVIRNGKGKEVAARDLVPGDIILLIAGDRVPADARLLQAINLKTEEASLTGESLPVEKSVDPLNNGASLGDRENMVFAGTTIAYGRGIAVITNTGMSTEFGRIATMLQEVKVERTPLQINLDSIGKWISIGALSLCFILVLIGLLRWSLAGVDIWPDKVLEMFIWGISLAIAAVPEALPAVVTISLSLGVQKLAKKHALIRKLPACETLGSTTYICTDKTGTLTQDQMTVKQVYTNRQIINVTGIGYEPRGEFKTDSGETISPDNPALQTLLKAGVLCNDSSLEKTDKGWKIKGDPTEGALIVLAAKAGMEQFSISNINKRITEIPFTSETKRMTTVNINDSGENIAYSKGALEVILASCSHIIIDGQIRVINGEYREEILSVSRKMAENALRILGVACKNIDNVEDDKLENDMVFIGMVGMVDPPREEVKPAIALCEQAGIRSVMITGDHKLTAVAIARELGLLKNGIAISGEELDKLNDKEFHEMVEKVDVYARVSPSHKLRVVEALTKKGHVVAMTGDGINDAPALKKADIGIAMGITGTDVTREAADMILADDNFASIVSAIQEGRGIFDNIKKYLVYLLSCNLGEILLMAGVIIFGSLLGLPAIPLIPIQILYINLATDGLPAIALSVEPQEKDIMKRKPRPRNQSIFTRDILIYLVITGIWTAIVCFLLFSWAWHVKGSHEEAQSICFVTLILIEFFNSLNCRSLENSVFEIGFFTNKWLLLALLWECILMTVIVYLPALQEAFQTFALSAQDWIICVFSALTIFIIAELYKFIRSRMKFGPSQA